MPVHPRITAPSLAKILLAGAAILVSHTLGAQYAIDWFTIDGGGGASTGGQYLVTGTIGQPDAGKLSGGTFTLEGGFWPGVLVAPSPGGAPSLFIQMSSGTVTIGWSPATPGFALEQASDPSAPSWSPAPGGNPVTIPIAGAARFYRLRKQ